MKTILSSMLALTFALGASTFVFAADPAVEEAWRNTTRAQNTPFEWALAKRLAEHEAKAGSQFALSGSIQSDASSAADPAVEEAWRNNTRAQNTPFEWAVAKRLAQASSQVASSGSIQSDASVENKSQVDTFEDEARPWLYFH